MIKNLLSCVRIVLTGYNLWACNTTLIGAPKVLYFASQH